LIDWLFSKQRISVALAVIAWSLLSALSDLQLLAKFDRSLLLNGEYWRLLTCHFVHVDMKHGFLNGLAVLLCLYIFNKLHFSDWAALTLTSALFISIALFVINPSILWYVGFSGVLHAWFAAGALAMILNGERILGICLLALLFIKLIWEQYTGVRILSEDALVITEAHLYGAIFGLIYAALFFRTGRECSKQ